MKKTLVMLTALAVVSAATADIAVSFENNGGVFTVGGGYTAANTAQLVWNDGKTVDIGEGYEVGLNLMAPGDIVLATAYAPAGNAGTFKFDGTVIGTDADVGADVTAGYLSVRVFDDANVGAGGLGFIFNVDVDGTLTTFDPLVASTTYITDPVGGGVIAGGEFNDLVSGTAGAVTVIPEPATLGLMGVAGLGMFLARKKARA